MTAYRVSDMVRRVFARRYVRSDNKPAISLKRLLEKGPADQLFSDLCMLYAARNDALIRDAVAHLYWPALAEGRLSLGPANVVEFLRQAGAETLRRARFLIATDLPTILDRAATLGFPDEP